MLNVLTNFDLFKICGVTFVTAFGAVMLCKVLWEKVKHGQKR